ncbi:hypothetical protein SBA4_2170010 [Candidatus Sulfopaludibacter sp. SbA4]|nr:hypothetical protein SBA4_2170010 [Candidatus Sulfopaludibacter sp. SbA4]
MMRSIRLTEEDRDFLRSVLTTLNLTQKVFADRAGVPQGWLSGVMAGKRPAVEPEMLARMGNAADTLLGEAEKELKIAASDAESLRKGIAQVFRIRQEAPALIAPVGGAIPTDATNFIERQPEMSMALNLLDGTPFTMAVEGGPLTGKTTFLRWFEEEAEKRGFEVAYVDCSDLAPVRESNDEELTASFNGMLGQLTEYLVEAWSLPAVRTDGIGFMNWWLRMKGPLLAGRPRPRLLILDGVTRLGPVIGEYLLKLVRNIHNARGPDGVALSFALGVDADIVRIQFNPTRSDAYSVVCPRFVMRRFDDEQIRSMLVAIAGEPLEKGWVSEIKTLAKNRHCQPYFVHAAANFLKAHRSLDALREEVDQSRGAFEAVELKERLIETSRSQCDSKEIADAYERLIAA